MDSRFIVFNGRDELNRIEFAKIVYFQADGNYTTIVTNNKLKISIGLNLSQMEKNLAAKLGANAGIFMRIGRSIIINTNYLCQINVLKQTIILTDYQNFTFKVGVPRDALKQVKNLVASQK